MQYACVPVKLGGGGLFACLARCGVGSPLPLIHDRKSPGSCLTTFYKSFILNVFKCSLQYLPHPFLALCLVALAPNAIGGIASFLMCAK